MTTLRNTIKSQRTGVSTFASRTDQPQTKISCNAYTKTVDRKAFQLPGGQQASL